MKSDVSSDETGTRSVKRAADIIRALVSRSEGRCLTDLARETNLSKATAYRIARTLTKSGLVDYSEASGTYAIGIQLVRIAMERRAGSGLTTIQNIHELSTPFMQRLSASTGETCALLMSFGDVRINIAVELGTHELIVSPKAGTGLPLHTGPGKVFLAYYSPTELDNYIQRTKLTRLTSRTISSPDELKQKLRHIRRSGYVISSGEAIEGQDSIAAPIFLKGKILAALNLIPPTVRSNDQKRKRFASQVLASASEISRLIEQTSGSRN